MDRDPHPENAAFPGAALHGHVAAVSLDDVLDDREPEPGSPAVLREERQHRFLEDLGRNPRAAVGHREDDLVADPLRRAAGVVEVQVGENQVGDLARLERALVSWFLDRRFGPGIASGGVTETMVGISLHGGYLPTRIIPNKILANYLSCY